LKSDVTWIWGPDQYEAMRRIKAILMSEPFLHFFDVTKDIVLQTNASKGGLGAVLLQEGRPAVYALRALN